MTRAGLAIGALLAAAMLAGCDDEQKGYAFGGHYFKTKAGPVDKKQTLADFTVAVKGASVSPDDARAAGAYEATRYCIQNYGNSRIDWTVGPDTEGLVIADDTLTLRGRCLRP